MRLCTAWLNRNDPRLDEAQTRMVETVFRMGHRLAIFEGEGARRPLLSEMLKATRALTGRDQHFGWINSDCIPLPSFHAAEAQAGFGVCGIHRIEAGTKQICGGVDAYVFNVGAWDKYYAPDIPEMFVGATMVDWWLTRLAQKYRIYRSFNGLIHLSHPRTPASRGEDAFGQANIRAFTAWAIRHNIETT